jgi:alpha-beta hydrolase superfamily lysophospholipase
VEEADISAGVRTTGRWIGPADRPLLSWLSVASTGPGLSGVVIGPPVGYGYAAAHRSLRTLAESLAGQGHTVLRVDYDGTGDSAGDQWDHDRVASWASSLTVAADELRALGAHEVHVVGLQLGACLVLHEANRLGARSVVLWDPVVDGRRFVREIRLLGTEVPSSEPPAHRGGIVHAGTVFSAGTMADLAGFGPARLETPPADRILVLDREEPTPSVEALTARLREMGADVDHDTTPGMAVALDEPAEYTTVPTDVLARIVGWIGPTHPIGGRRKPPPTPATVTLAFHEERVQEEVVTLGPDDLVGVLTRPPVPPLATVVWLNAGSEPHVGPGRAWVEFARALACKQYASLRLDFSGWGESPDLGRAPGRPYDAHCVEDTINTVDALAKLGHRHVVVAGLCAGAWVAMRAALSAAVSGIVAINPQLYWQPGDPVEADIVNETRVRREDEIDQYAWGARTGLWSALDRLGAPHPASNWLDELGRRPIPTLALFAQGDDGLEFLQDRVGTAWSRAGRSGAVEVEVLDGLDHPMHHHWKRGEVVEAVTGFLHRRVAAPLDLRPASRSPVATARSGATEHPPWA